MAVRPQQQPAATEQPAPAKRETTRTDAGPGSLAGNLTRDPELRYTPSGQAVVSLRVAVQERVFNERTDKWEDKPPEYFDVTAWRQLAEHIAEYLAKGQRIVAEGRWESQSWTDTEGVTQERIVMIASDLGPSMKFAGARPLARERRPS